MQDDELTVVDICLGLSPEQVLAALQDHDATLPIQQGRGSYNYTNGAETLRTEPFVSEIRAESNMADTYFEFHFTAPPEEGRLTHMQRALGAEGNNLPALETLTDGLIAKYGQPDFRFDDAGFEIIRVLRWHFPEGGSACVDPSLKESSGVRMASGRVNGPASCRMQNVLRLRAWELPASAPSGCASNCAPELKISR